MVLSPLKKGLLVIIISAAISLGLAKAYPSVSTPRYAEYAVVIIIDGCRPEYLKLAPLPHIREIGERGITYNLAWVGQIPNTTPASHATLGTGVFPAHHHVVGFRWKDPETDKSFYPRSLENIRRGAFAKVISDAKVPSVFDLYKKEHPKERTLAISSMKSYAAIPLGNFGADYTLFMPPDKKEDIENGEESMEIGKNRLFEALSGREVEGDLLNQINHKIKSYQQPGDPDTWAVEAFLAVFNAKRPKLSMINLPGIDITGHKCGGLSSPEAIKPVIENVDLQIGKIIKVFKEAGIFEKTLFVITADHGMVTNSYDISVGSYILAFRGLNSWPQLGITTPFIWLRDSNRSGEVARKIGELKPFGINYVFYKEDAVYRSVSKNKEGLPEDVYRYFLQTLVCPNSPDIVLFTKENAIIGKEFPLNTHGQHCQTTWFAQHIPLVISGPGVRSGGHSDMPARLVDIPPTVLTLMGIESNSMDGLVLADALKNPSPEQIKMQEEIGARLKKYQSALIYQSQYDLKEVPVLPKVRFWNSLWFYDVMVLVFFGLALLIIKVARLPGKLNKVVLLVSLFLLIASQIFFILLLRALLEV